MRDDPLPDDRGEEDPFGFDIKLAYKLEEKEEKQLFHQVCDVYSR